MWFKKLGIFVSQAHIDNGWSRRSSYCPIALTIKDLCPKGFEVHVMNHYIAIRDPDTNTYYTVEKGNIVPSKLYRYTPLGFWAQRFISRFDAGLTVKPSKF